MSKHRFPLADRKALGRRLKTAREAVQLTQGQAARRLGLRVTTTLSNYEQGRTEIPLRLLAGMSALYRIKLEALLLGTPRAAVDDLDTRRHYARIRRQGQELLRDLDVLVRQLDKLFKPLDTKRSANG